MAFDLVQYFNDQIKIQNPYILKNYDQNLRDKYIQEINALVLGKIVTLWQHNKDKQFDELKSINSPYIESISQSLITSENNSSQLTNHELQSTITDTLVFQLKEIQQLESTGNYGILGLKELILGQIEHLSGEADDWVWLTNGLIELKGSKPIHQEDISLELSMKEFNQMVQQHSHTNDVQDSIEMTAPTWAKILEPIIAIAILFVLAKALCSVFI